jgi:hypothetical protein
MDQRKAFLFFGFMVLVWMVFWNVALRTWIGKRIIEHEDTPAFEGLAVAI